MVHQASSELQEARAKSSDTTKKKQKQKQKRRFEMSLVWMEALLPLGIIAGMLCVMGNSQYYIHKAAHGRPKHIGNDVWDVAMERRDKKLTEMLSPSTN